MILIFIAQLDNSSGNACYAGYKSTKKNNAFFYLENRRVISNDCKDVLLPNIRISARDSSYDITDLNIFLYDRSTIKANVEWRLVDIRNLNAETSLNEIWRISIVNTFDSYCLIENQPVCRQFKIRLKQLQSKLSQATT